MMLNTHQNIQIKKNRRSFSWKRLIIIITSTIAIFIVAAILFIKLDVGAAANFTDDVLRPVLGANNVIAIEKIFFNTSDKINQFFSHFEKQKSPFISNGNNSPHKINIGTLDLNPVPTSVAPLLAQEGQWQNLPLSLFPNQIVMADTFIRPDPSRSYAFVTLVQLDMSKLRLSSVAGTLDPAAIVGNPGPGMIPKTIQDQGNLVAAFDGGFQYRDGQYGMIVGDKTYLPLKKDIATIVGYTNGKIEIVKYEGQDFGSNVAFVRQNCPMLIENGTVEANNPVNRALWGRTTTWQIATWRSGVGITAQGNLVFAIGNSLLPDTLANALKAAGAVNAMQLDINPDWVRFNIFNNFSSGQYESTPIMQGIKDGSYEFLNGDKKDFFYVTKKI